MITEIKKSVEMELVNYFNDLSRAYHLNKFPPVLLNNIKGFILRKGKRIRPVLFILGYSGFTKKKPDGLYRTAMSLELLHNSILVHDDIIDKSSIRRGKPSLHRILNEYVARHKNTKFNGNDLAIIMGDIMYALGTYSFLSVKEDARRKEIAFKKLVDAAVYTGNGEFLDIISSLENIDKITLNDIYKIYDLKTAIYTFSAPLTIGAILAGAGKKDIDKLFKFGIYLGRAFQIKDDITDMFSKKPGLYKSNLNDIKESKKTILIWRAYNKSGLNVKSCIKKIISKKNITKNEQLKICGIIRDSDALNYAKNQIDDYLNKALLANTDSRMRPGYRQMLETYSMDILNN
ncbi:MAG: polyprenyl synthetase family protein [Candidatus Omnitrophica bacterium]|nr:polyprenyl synthetase family protein [Candidatus Omnitrophota bacterium]